MNTYFNEMASLMYSKRQKFLVPTGKTENNEDKSRIVATAAHILLSRNMMMSDELVNALMNSNLSCEELSEYFVHMLKVTDDAYGYRSYKPFYKNFPKEVMEADTATLVINAILHYISGGTIVPESNANEDLYAPIAGLFKNAVRMNSAFVRIVHPATVEDFFGIAKNLISANTSISANDKEFLRVAIAADASIVPDEMPHKENKAVVIASMLSAGIMEHKLYMGISTPTDVLRIAVALSEGDVSLKVPCRFKSFPRNIRKWIMDMMECMPGAMEEDMLKYRERWLRIGERIHPNAFRHDEYERAIDAFDVLRNNENSIVSFASKVERAFMAKKCEQLLDLLSTKPGYFARELHHMLKTFPNNHYAIAVRFAAVVNNVATPVLFQVKSYYQNKLFQNGTGIYFPKGNTQRIFVRTDCETISIQDEIVNLIVLACEHGIASQFRAKYVDEYNEEKKVYIDPTLKDYLIPFSQRSASKALRVVPRGSKMAMDDNQYIRPFIHWMNGKERTDVDLSIAFLDKNYKLIDTVSYYELRNAYAVHSGDYTNAPAPEGACEFVDINTEKALANGVRYAALMVHAYTQEPFREIPDCYVGYMTIESKEYDVDYNKHHNPYKIENVRMKMDISNDGQYVMVCAFDLENKGVYWCDVAGMAEQRIYIPNNVETTQHVISFMIQSIIESKRENMYNLARLTVAAKGYQVIDNAEDADITYTVEPVVIEGKENVSAFDTDVWQAMV